MKKLGCLTLIVLIGLAVYFLMSSQGLTDEQKAQLVGEKVHRGWQEVSRLAEQAKKGWDKAPADANARPAAP